VEVASNWQEEAKKMVEGKATGHNMEKHKHTQPFYDHYTGQPALASIPRQELEDFQLEQGFTTSCPC